MLRDAVQQRSPRLLLARPALHAGREPGGVVERAGLEVRHALDVAHHVVDARAALGTEVATHGTPALRAALEGLELTFEREVGARHHQGHAERAARLALALFAVADRKHQGLAAESI